MVCVCETERLIFDWELQNEFKAGNTPFRALKYFNGQNGSVCVAAVFLQLKGAVEHGHVGLLWWGLLN